MTRFTSLEFMEALGLGYSDYNGAKILLRLLAQKGVAKEVGKISPKGKGRPQVVYEIPEEITISVKPPDSIPCHPPKKKKVKVAEIVDVAMGSKTAEEIVAEAMESKEEVVAEEEVVATQSEVAEVLVPVATTASEGEYEWDDGWEDD